MLVQPQHLAQRWLQGTPYHCCKRSHKDGQQCKEYDAERRGDHELWWYDLLDSVKLCIAQYTTGRNIREDQGWHGYHRKDSAKNTTEHERQRVDKPSLTHYN